LLPASALADVKAGVDDWSRGNYTAAVREWKGPADKGDADALFNLGQAYKLGRGVKADLARAEQLFGQAAAKGHLQASDLYGLLLFQRGERERAIPYVIAAAERGEPRAQYLLGVAHFNGDAVPKDWVRAYALTSLALQAGIPQAKNALAQMDRMIPLAQRQQAAALAPELATRAEATRARQLAAIDLGASIPDMAAAPVPRAAPPPSPALATSRPQTTRETAELAAGIAGVVADDTPRTAGADFARPQVAQRPVQAAPQPVQVARPAQVAPLHAPRPAAAAPVGRFSVQLGAFSVADNAEALWAKIKGRSELAGTSPHLVDAGRLTRLLATGFATRAAAETACARLSAAGIGCLVPRN
jgi:cell division septation protein DedD